MDKFAYNRNSGFTIMEIVVVLGMIAVGLVGVSALVIQNVQVQYADKNTLIASQLAQEGIELMRYKRDNNWISGLTWNSGFTANGNYRADYQLDASKNLLYFHSVSGWNDASFPTTLKDNNNYYCYGNGAANNSIFKRMITVSNTTSTSTNIASAVQWTDKSGTHTYQVNALLTDWR